MKIQKPIISDLITADQINKSCSDDIKIFTEIFFQLEFTWMKNAYNAFKDIDKYVILLFLINKTFRAYKEHFYTLSFEDFINSKTIEIEKISIIEIVNELSITKETVRRKLNELNKSGVIKRDKKKISVINPFNNQKPINNILELSKLLTYVSQRLGKMYNLNNLVSKNYYNLIKKNYTLHWHTFLNFQLKYYLRMKKNFGTFENFYIFGTCAVNQSYNLKNSYKINNAVSLNVNNYAEVVTDHTKYKSNGLNPTTISELTNIPRASVIRKLKWLLNQKFLVKNKQNLYSIISMRENPNKFLKIGNIFQENQASLRNCLKDLLNLTNI